MPLAKSYGLSLGWKVAAGFAAAAPVSLTPGQKATLAKLMQAASDTANGNNPVEAAVASPAPTVTVASSFNAALTVTASWQGATTPIIHSPAKLYTTSGGKIPATTTWDPAQGGAAGGFPTATGITPTNGFANPAINGATIPNGSNAFGTSCYFRIPAAATKFGYCSISGSSLLPHRLTIDGVMQSRDGQANSGNHFMSVDLTGFPAAPAAGRLVKLESQTNVTLGFGGLAVPTGMALQPVALPYLVTDAYHGDSITEGLQMGANQFWNWDAYPQTFSNLTAPYNLVANCAVGGTGIINNVGGFRQTIGQQLEFLMNSYTFDRVGYMGGYNDADIAPVATIVAQAFTDWKRIRVQQPNALIMIPGVLGQSITANDGSTRIILEQALKAQWLAWGDPFSMFFDVSPNYANAIVKDTTYTSFLSDDVVHPSRAGAISLAKIFAARYRTKLLALHLGVAAQALAV